MIHTYPELTQEQIDSAGKTFVRCDHAEFQPAVYENAKYVTDEDVGQPRPDRPGEAWEPRDVGVQYDRGTLVSEAIEGERCSNSAELVVEHAKLGGRDFFFAPVPEGWVTSDTDGNALSGAADFCPDHADSLSASAPESVAQEGAPPEEG